MCERNLDEPFGPKLYTCFRGGVGLLQWLQLQGLISVSPLISLSLNKLMRVMKCADGSAQCPLIQVPKHLGQIVLDGAKRVVFESGETAIVSVLAVNPDHSSS